MNGWPGPAQTATQGAAPIDFQEIQQRIRDCAAEAQRKEAQLPALDAKARERALLTRLKPPEFARTACARELAT